MYYVLCKYVLCNILFMGAWRPGGTCRTGQMHIRVSYLKTSFWDKLEFPLKAIRKSKLVQATSCQAACVHADVPRPNLAGGGAYHIISYYIAYYIIVECSVLSYIVLHIIVLYYIPERGSRAARGCRSGGLAAPKYNRGARRFGSRSFRGCGARLSVTVCAHPAGPCRDFTFFWSSHRACAARFLAMVSSTRSNSAGK